MKDKKLHRIQMGKCQKSLLVGNYFKCKWIKCPNQKTEISRMDLKKKKSMIQLYAIYKRH